MLPSSHTLSKITVQAARKQGWDVRNTGEAVLALELGHLGYTPADIETQFRLGSYRLDFAIPTEQIDIEADGWVHTAKDVRARDRARDRQLRAWGWIVIRIDNDGDIQAQLRRHVPSRKDIADYGKTLRQIHAIFEAYLSRAQRRGQADPKKHLEQMRDMLLAAHKASYSRNDGTG